MPSKKLSKTPAPAKPACKEAETSSALEAPSTLEEETAIRALQGLGCQFYFGHAKMTTLVRFVQGQTRPQLGYLFQIAVPEKTLLGATARETLAAKAKKKRDLAKAKKVR